MSILTTINNALGTTKGLSKKETDHILEELQEKYLRKFDGEGTQVYGEEELIARSHAQYQAQQITFQRWQRLAQGILSGVSGPILKMKYSQKDRGNGGHQENEVKSQKPLAIYLGVSDKVIGPKLQEAYHIIKVPETLLLTRQDEAFLRKCAKGLKGKAYFLAKLRHKVALYHGLIETYQPKAIIATSEYSFTSSCLTLYCQEHGLVHINVMHGDKIYLPRDSFFAFHRCYVWDQAYEELFGQLKAHPDQFRVDVPPSLKFYKDLPQRPRLTYYLQKNSLEELERLAAVLPRVCQENELELKVRPHPIYSDLDQITKLFGQEVIEDAQKVDIETSILSARYLSSQYSTVLYQGHVNGRQVILDDVSNPKLFHELSDLKYIMFNKPHGLLSTMAGDVSIQTLF